MMQLLFLYFSDSVQFVHNFCRHGFRRSNCSGNSKCKNVSYWCTALIYKLIDCNFWTKQTDFTSTHHMTTKSRSSKDTLFCELLLDPLFLSVWG